MTSCKTQTERNLDLVLDAAMQHGLDSEPDHEVGDLQQAFELSFRRLSDQDQLQVIEQLKTEYDWMGLDGET